MKKLNELHKKISDNDITCFELDLKLFDAATIEADNKYSIFTKPQSELTEYQLFSLLAHEYGHCKSGATHKIHSPFDTVERHEYRADRRAVLDLLPFSLIQDAFKNGCCEAWQISEYLDIPQDFVEKALCLYEDKITTLNQLNVN